MVTGRIPSTGSLQRVVFSDEGEIRREPLLTELKQRIRYVAHGPDDLLYLLTDHSDGALLRLAPLAPGSGPGAGSELLSFEGEDCQACHRTEMRLVGPSWLEIARRYESSEDNLALLAERIIAGSVGVWNESPMSPHPQLSEADARDMVSRILALDDQDQ
jgi:cytochrome c551/c552